MLNAPPNQRGVHFEGLSEEILEPLSQVHDLDAPLVDQCVSAQLASRRIARFYGDLATGRNCITAPREDTVSSVPSFLTVTRLDLPNGSRVVGEVLNKRVSPLRA